MSDHILYAYVEGADLEGIATELVARLDAFVGGSNWIGAVPSVVNQRYPVEGLREGDLQLWDLGINLALPDLGQEMVGWFQDIEQLVRFLAQLHAQFDRDFVLGVAVVRTGLTEDLFTIDSMTPDLGELRRIIGVA